MSLPTSTITASTSLQFCNLATVTGLGYTSLPIIQANANTFTKTLTFNLTRTMNNIAGLAVTGVYTIFNNLTTGSLRIASTTAQIYLDAKTQLRASINLFETKPRLDKLILLGSQFLLERSNLCASLNTTKKN